MISLASLIKVVRYSKHIGILSALRLFYIEKISRKNRIYKLKYKSRIIYLRSRSTDIIVFDTVFLQKQYPIFEEYKPNTIIDGGANIGLSTLYFKMNYPSARIIAIEPDSDNCTLFNLNTSGLNNIYLLKGGLWSDNNLKLIIKNPNAESYSFRLEPSEVGMQVYTINEIMKEFSINTIDILKLDVEGAEYDLFKSNTSWLENVNNIMIEIHDHYAPNASQVVLGAIGLHKFWFKVSGENIIFYKNSYKWVTA